LFPSLTCLHDNLVLRHYDNKSGFRFKNEAKNEETHFDTVKIVGKFLISNFTKISTSSSTRSCYFGNAALIIEELAWENNFIQPSPLTTLLGIR